MRITDRWTLTQHSRLLERGLPNGVVGLRHREGTRVHQRSELDSTFAKFVRFLGYAIITTVALIVVAILALVMLFLWRLVWLGFLGIGAS